MSIKPEVGGILIVSPLVFALLGLWWGLGCLAVSWLIVRVITVAVEKGWIK